MICFYLMRRGTFRLAYAQIESNLYHSLYLLYPEDTKDTKICIMKRQKIQIKISCDTNDTIILLHLRWKIRVRVRHNHFT